MNRNKSRFGGPKQPPEYKCVFDHFYYSEQYEHWYSTYGEVEDWMPIGEDLIFMNSYFSGGCLLDANTGEEIWYDSEFDWGSWRNKYCIDESGIFYCYNGYYGHPLKVDVSTKTKTESTLVYNYGPDPLLLDDIFVMTGTRYIDSGNKYQVIVGGVNTGDMTAEWEWWSDRKTYGGLWNVSNGSDLLYIGTPSDFAVLDVTDGSVIEHFTGNYGGDHNMIYINEDMIFCGGGKLVDPNDGSVYWQNPADYYHDVVGYDSNLEQIYTIHDKYAGLQAFDLEGNILWNIPSISVDWSYNPFIIDKDGYIYMYYGTYMKQVEGNPTDRWDVDWGFVIRKIEPTTGECEWIQPLVVNCHDYKYDPWYVGLYPEVYWTSMCYIDHNSKLLAGTYSHGIIASGDMLGDTINVIS